MSNTGKKSMVLAIVFFIITGLVVLSINTKPTTWNSVRPYLGMQPVDEFEDAAFESNGKWYGLCDKNSIRSVEDFRRTVTRDPALRIHYATFNWDNARMARLEYPVLAYVYFRNEGQISRKARPIRLVAGDEYITDGDTRVRTHCCNNYVLASEEVYEPALHRPTFGVPEPATVLFLGTGIIAFGAGNFLIRKHIRRKKK